MADEKHTRETLAGVLGALGPGGTAAIRFEDHERLFGSEPTEDELESRRLAQFAKDNGCTHKIDPSEKRVVFTKVAGGPTLSKSSRQTDPSPSQR
jgi:hypothetical protein